VGFVLLYIIIHMTLFLVAVIGDIIKKLKACCCKDEFFEKQAIVIDSASLKKKLAAKLKLSKK